ncbi:NAD(P)-binding protein [Hypoxylon fragiforme]|uniref:NAD(P)-binding protein n=1 Tax=Hypoxylon fragiforme TaxID=63214 RepID=UPI0020C6D753|nr:NAD(P)-binding protein [Hypoxylon fragiforme]KAI2614018.1 NAD(P)-binding protein [Hypoxylon fragiforme]
MDVSINQVAFTAIAALIIIAVAWVWKLNSALKETPPEVLAASPRRWTDQEIMETYERLKTNPLTWKKHLPPKLERRYIVTGGSGGVGGQIVLHLLERGQSPESIRIVDFRKPERPDMTTGLAARVDFAQADITSAPATSAAFTKPWPASVSTLPLTVFHTAAIIRPSERLLATYAPVKRVNIDGVQHVLAASQRARASVLVATSSGSIAAVPVDYWGSSPFSRRWWPRHFWQAVDEADFERPVRAHGRFFGNYAHAKAVGERLVSEANAPGLRTGIVRPANGVYGCSHNDVLVGPLLCAGTCPTWIPNVVENFVHTGHVSLAHLDFEAALLKGEGEGEGGEMPKCAGRPFVVTDDGPPLMFCDLYRLLTCTAGTRFVYLQPALMLVIAYVVEFFDWASRMPVLGWIVPRPRGELARLQPPIFTAATHLIASDEAARRSVEDGGIGYKPVYNSLEGICQQVLEWNAANRGSDKGGSRSTAETLGR